MACRRRRDRDRPSFGEERGREVTFAQVRQDRRRSACRYSRWRAAHRSDAAAPQEMPQSIPSSRASRRVISNGLVVANRDHLVDHLEIEHVGDEPAPIPWILCGPGRSGSMARARLITGEFIGSTATT